MSFIDPTNDSQDSRHSNDNESMDSRKQLQGILVIILFLLLAILLRSI